MGAIKCSQSYYITTTFPIVLSARMAIVYRHFMFKRKTLK